MKLVVQSSVPGLSNKQISITASEGHVRFGSDYLMQDAAD